MFDVALVVMAAEGSSNVLIISIGCHDSKPRQVLAWTGVSVVVAMGRICVTQNSDEVNMLHVSMR